MSQTMQQILETSGKLKGKEPALSREQLLHFYKMMVLTRTLDDRALKLQRAGRIGFYVSCLGQEASAVGAAGALQKDDWVFPTYRDPGMALTMGASIADMLHQCFGNAKDLTKGRQMPVHYSFVKPRFVSISSPIGTQLSQAVGAAMAMQLRKKKTLALAGMGDGGTSSNDFHSAMNFAAVYKAPVIFFCQNNRWAISVPYEKQTGSETIAQKAVAYGMPGIRVDGNDVLAVYQAVKEAGDRARKGQGPTFIEAVTFRMGSHSSSDDWTRYRDKKEVEEWAKKDPISRFQKYLAGKKLWNEKVEKDTQDWATEQLTAAIREAESAGAPSMATMFEDVYAQMTPQLREQWEELKALEASGAKGDTEEGAFPL